MDSDDVAAWYEAGQRALEDLDYDLAIEHFERVVGSDPDYSKATAKLAGLLQYKGRRAADEGDFAGALDLYERSRSLVADDPKLEPRIAAALRGLGRDELARGDVQAAVAALERILDLVPDDAATEGLLLALGDLPTTPLDALWPPPPDDDRPDLVVIEQGIHGSLLDAYLRHMPSDHVAVSEPRLPVEVGERSPNGITALLDVGTEGLERVDVHIANQTDPLGDRLRERTEAVLDRSVHEVAGIDLLERLSYRYQDTLFVAGKTVHVLVDLLRSGRFRRAIFLLGTNRLTRIVRPLAVDLLGAERVLSYWASHRLRLYDAEPWPSTSYSTRAEGLSTGLRTPRKVSPPRSDVSAPRTLRTWRRTRVAGDPRICVLASPMAQHVQNSAPVLDALAGHAHVDIPVLSTRDDRYPEYRELTTRHPDRIRLDVAFAERVVDDSADPVALPRHLRWATNRLLTEPPGAPFSLDGVDLWPILEPALEDLLRSQFPRYRRFAVEFDSHLARTRPDVLIVAPDRFPEARIAAALAREHGIPSLFPQAAVFSASPRWKPLQADVITVHDDYTAELYRSYFGCEPDRIRTTGIPRFASLLQRRDELLAAPRADGGERVVMLALQRYADDYCDALLGAVGRALAAVDDTILSVRMHPRDPAERIPGYERALLRHLPAERFRVGYGGPIEPELAAADLVISGWSTVVIEAAMLDRTVVCINLTGEPLPVPYVQMGLAAGADDEEGAVSVLSRTLQDADARAAIDARRAGYFARNPHLLTQDPAELVAAAVLDLARGGSTPT